MEGGREPTPASDRGSVAGGGRGPAAPARRSSGSPHRRAAQGQGQGQSTGNPRGRPRGRGRQTLTSQGHPRDAGAAAGAAPSGERRLPGDAASPAVSTATSPEPPEPRAPITRLLIGRAAVPQAANGHGGDREAGRGGRPAGCGCVCVFVCVGSAVWSVPGPLAAVRTSCQSHRIAPRRAVVSPATGTGSGAAGRWGSGAPRQDRPRVRTDTASGRAPCQDRHCVRTDTMSGQAPRQDGPCVRTDTTSGQAPRQDRHHVRHRLTGAC